MCVPSEVAGVVETAFVSAAPSVVNSLSTLSFGPNTTIATGRSFFRWARNARDAAIAFLIGAPFMLFDASTSKIAPLLSPPGGVTARDDDGARVLGDLHLRCVQRLRLRQRQEIGLVGEARRRRLGEPRRDRLRGGCCFFAAAAFFAAAFCFGVCA